MAARHKKKELLSAMQVTEAVSHLTTRSSSKPTMSAAYMAIKATGFGNVRHPTQHVKALSANFIGIT